MQKTIETPVITDTEMETMTAELQVLSKAQSFTTPDLYPHESTITPRYGQQSQAIKRYSISRSTFIRLRDTDPDFPSWFKRGRLGLYDFAKLDNYFSA